MNLFLSLVSSTKICHKIEKCAFATVMSFISMFPSLSLFSSALKANEIPVTTIVQLMTTMHFFIFLALVGRDPHPEVPDASIPKKPFKFVRFESKAKKSQILWVWHKCTNQSLAEQERSKSCQTTRQIPVFKKKITTPWDQTETRNSLVFSSAIFLVRG